MAKKTAEVRRRRMGLVYFSYIGYFVLCLIITNKFGFVCFQYFFGFYFDLFFCQQRKKLKQFFLLRIQTDAIP